MDNTIIVGKNKISYTVKGKGQPLVFLHGFLENSSIWDNVVEKLTDNYCVLLIDLPGHGKSRQSSSILSIVEMAKCVKATIDFLNISNSIVFGHSLGGYVALELAKMIDINLALIHSNFWEDDIKKKEARDRMTAVVEENLTLFVKMAIPNLFYPENRIVLKERIDTLVENASEIKKEAVISCAIGMRDRLHNGIVLENQKIAIIQGEFDPVIPEMKMKQNLEQIKNKPFYFKISNCGHMGFFEQPVTFFKAILSVIDKFYGIKLNN